MAFTVAQYSKSYQVSLSVGPSGKRGPLLFYWHATAMTYSEVDYGYANFKSDVLANGGVVASFIDTTTQGSNTGNGVWYTGDINIADEILACAYAQGFVDPCRIHVSGYSAGGLQTAAMAYLRSGYVASVISISGGFMTNNAYKLQDIAHVPSSIAAHGASGSDVLVLDFAACSATYCKSVAASGGEAINCGDGSGHIDGMMTREKNMGSIAAQFFSENRFGTPMNYTATLPSYLTGISGTTCTLTQ